VGIKIKPEKPAEFLEIIKHDAEHSLADEPGGMRFEVPEDAGVANELHFWEAYPDEAALEYHRTIANIVINGCTAEPVRPPSRERLP
jgi:quinol monooxygenase YgiN